jgi:hypothetical protein
MTARPAAASHARELIITRVLDAPCELIWQAPRSSPGPPA